MNSNPACLPFQRAKERKHYTDMDIDEDDIDGKRNYNIEEKLMRNNFTGDFVQEMKGQGGNGDAVCFVLSQIAPVCLSLSVSLSFSLSPATLCFYSLSVCLSYSLSVCVCVCV